MAVIITAFLYFAAVFAVAFAMGVARVLVVAPRVGPMVAVLVEVPIVLAVSWIIARRLLRGRPFGDPQRAMIGGIAFALLMASEAALAGLIRDQSISQWAMALATPLGLVGMAGQLGFAAIPFIAGHTQKLN